MKKHTILILRLLALMLAFSITTAGATENTSEQSVQNSSEYAEDIEILEKIGVIKGYKEGTFNPSERVTRSELAMLSACMMGMDEMGFESELLYHDVPSNYWAANYIKAVTAMKVMVGYDGFFNPEEYVDIRQASKVMVELLGYKDYAAISGGYPEGYLVVANQLGILDKISTEGDFTRGKVARLILNTLNTVIHDNELDEAQEKPLMEKTLGVKRAEGRVESTFITSLWGNATCGEGSLVIDNEMYEIPDNSYNAFLGREIEYYYISPYNQGGEILHAGLLNKRSSEYTVASEDICADDTRFGINTFVYTDEKEKKQTENIAGAVVIINGKASNDGVTKSDLAPADGKVTLIDDDGDNKTDIVLVDSFTTAVVSIVNTTVGTIVDKLGGKMTETENADFVEIEKDGKAVILSALKEDDVILIRRSKDEKAIKIIASSKTVSGKVSSYSAEDGAMIDGQRYKFNPVFDKTQIKLGNVMNFVLDSEGRIAHITTSKTEGQYGYLFNITYNKDDEKVFFKLFTQDGKHIFAEGAEKILLNYDGRVTYDNLVSTLRDGKERAETMVFYKTDKDGKITHIFTPEDDSEPISPDYPRAQRHFSKSLNIFGMYESAGFSVDPTVPIFYIVEASDEDCRMITTADLADKTPYIAAGYGAGDTMRPKVISVFVEEGSESNVEIIWSTPVGVITQISKALNEDNEEVSCVHMFTKGQEMRFNVARTVNTRKVEFPSTKQASVDFSEFKRGDVVYYELNYKGELSGICRAVPYNADGEIRTETEWCHSHGFSAGKIFGTANRYTNGLLEVTTNGMGYLFPVGSAPVTVVDVKNDDIYAGSMEDLVPKALSQNQYSKIYLRAGGGVIDDAVIFTNWE